MRSSINCTFAAEMTCRPRPLPSLAPSIIPGKSRTWISAPPYSSTPGIAVNVVNEYAATSDFVFVTFERNVDLPTEGKPTSAIRASPDFDTSNPVPAAPPAPGPGSNNCARNLASLLKSCQFLVCRLGNLAMRTLSIDQGDTLLSISRRPSQRYFSVGVQTRCLILFVMSAHGRYRENVLVLCVLFISSSILGGPLV